MKIKTAAELLQTQVEDAKVAHRDAENTLKDNPCVMNAIIADDARIDLAYARGLRNTYLKENNR